MKRRIPVCPPCVMGNSHYSKHLTRTHPIVCLRLRGLHVCLSCSYQVSLLLILVWHGTFPPGDCLCRFVAGSVTGARKRPIPRR